jgi:triosephosphate isomerase
MKILIVANWKCNPTTLKQAKRLFNLVKKGVKSVSRRVKNREVVICPPFLYISNLKSQVSNIKIGAQDCFWAEKGTFTGGISPSMLKNLGCKYVIVGHSERRRYFKETDGMINKKLKAVFKTGLKPILCVEKITQIKKDIEGVSKKELRNLILAYEPVWAIGTGKACGIPEAKKINLSIRKILKRNILLYGGSIDSRNARDFIKKAKFQGLLVGGASLSAQEFIKIVKVIS